MPVIYGGRRSRLCWHSEIMPGAAIFESVEIGRGVVPDELFIRNLVYINISNRNCNIKQSDCPVHINFSLWRIDGQGLFKW